MSDPELKDQALLRGLLSSLAVLHWDVATARAIEALERRPDPEER